MKRVIVIGLDGFEPEIVEALLVAGELPNLARLMADGGYARLRTTCPAQTPVAWSTFATGTNPGGHGIFDFIRRDCRTYLPDLTFTRYVQKNPFLPARAINLRRGTAIWELLTRSGIPSTILRFPCTFPPDEIRGRMLSGMGVPDLRGGFGTSTFYTSAPTESQEGERVVQVIAGQVIETHIIGPRHPKTGDDLVSHIKIHSVPDTQNAILTFEGQPLRLELSPGKWSDWVKVGFKAGPLQTIRGMVRFHLLRVSPVFELYASPVNFDPETPIFPVSSPSGYARELSRQIGNFHTAGMPEDHAGLNNGRLDECAFLDQCEGVLRERERMMLYELERFDNGMFFCLFDTPDRVQHMFRRFGESSHPANKRHASPDLKQAVEDHYRRCDAIVGRAMDFALDETLFAVLSDHGMNSFQRGVHLNTWLRDNGLLTLRKDHEEAALQKGDNHFLRHVDWSRTRAYAIGMSGIYLNLAGREEQGIVDRDDAPRLKSAIADALSDLGDPLRGNRAVRSVRAREDVYHGPYAPESPDLMINFASGYRVSWATALGGLGTDQFEDNSKKWSGDHLVDPDLVPGVLFMNREFRGNPALHDMAPTILAALGVPKGGEMEGDSLLV